jgi:hypothetical protein
MARDRAMPDPDHVDKIDGARVKIKQHYVVVNAVTRILFPARVFRQTESLCNRDSKTNEQYQIKLS